MALILKLCCPPHASKYMVLSTPYHTKSSGPFCCLHNFNFCGTIPFPFCRVIVSSADAPSKRNERLYGRNDGVFVFWILLHSSLQSQPVTASYQLAVSIYQLAMWPVVKCFLLYGCLSETAMKNSHDTGFACRQVEQWIKWAKQLISRFRKA